MPCLVKKNLVVKGTIFLDGKQCILLVLDMMFPVYDRSNSSFLVNYLLNCRYRTMNNLDNS